MNKKLMLACMAIAAFAAFVIAPVASGAVLTENGTALATGTSITAKNTGNTLFTGPFNVSCTNAHLQGTVTTNSGGVIKGEIPVGSATFTGTGTGTDCTSALGAAAVTVNSKLCLEVAKGTDTVVTNGCTAKNEKGEVTNEPVEFTLTVTGTGPCKYSTASVSGPLVTNTTPASASLSEQEAKKKEGGIFCPSSGKLDMTFDIYTTGGVTGLTIS
jgi:hypothetical protein